MDDVRVGTWEVRSTLRDPVLQDHLALHGYVVVPLLEPAEAERLADAASAIGPAPGDAHDACHSSFQSYDVEHKRRVNAAIEELLWPAVQRITDDQRMLPGSFINKWPGERSGFGLHQDLSLTDERRFRSVVIWAALDDTTPENGQLWVVPGSHRWLGNPRGVQAFDFPYVDLAQEIVEHHGVAVEVRRGEAVIFANSLLHFSPPNRSERLRRVALTQIIPKEAPNLHYFGDGRGAVDVYEIPDDSFWVESNPFVLWEPPPSLSHVDCFHGTGHQLTQAELDDYVADGRAIVSEVAPGPINTDYSWCHRCGSTEVDGYPPSPWIGNVTLLCAACRVLEQQRAGLVAGLRDPKDRHLLDTRGHLEVPLLDPLLTAEVREVYDRIGLDPRHTAIATTNHLEPAQARVIDQELRDLIRARVRDLLPGYEVFLAGFVSKGADIGEPHPLHQDVTFTDERIHRTILLWVPLVDVDDANGALRVIDGSHLWTDGIRPGCPTPPTAAIQQELEPLATTLSLPAGTAVVYDPAIIHGSGTNATGEPRPALVAALAPRGAPLVHFGLQQGVLSGAHVDPSFFTDRSIYLPASDEPPCEPWAEAVGTEELLLQVRSRTAPTAVGPSAPAKTRRHLLGVDHGRSLLPAPPHPVLCDPEADLRLRRDGFVVVDVISRAQAVRLRNLYAHVHGGHGTGFEPDLTNEDTAYRRRVSQLLGDELDEAVGSLFVDHEPYLRNFLCKWPGEGSDLYLHRDWMYVDETGGDHTYVTWMPLVDVGWEQGPLQVLRHSHRVDAALRGTDLSSPWVDRDETVRSRLLTVPAQAGQAVILDNALVHCSPENRSERARPVAAIGMRRRGAQLVHYRRIDAASAARYDMPDDFLLDCTPQGLMAAPPDLPVAKVIVVPPPVPDREVTRRLGTSLLTRVDDAHRAADTARTGWHRARAARRAT